MKILHLLPTRVARAAENMAIDFLLLQRYPESTLPRFRHYAWHTQAFTFGYSQKYAWVIEQLPKEETFDVCRRPTGGGIVDHRQDWTFSLVIPRGHPLEEIRATQSYREIHECLIQALVKQGIKAKLQAAEDTQPAEGITGVCFRRAEVFDVVMSDTGEKIAGAAQKRSKHGLLFQGSLSRQVIGDSIDWDLFHEDFTTNLGILLGAPAQQTPWPEFNEDELSGLIEQYSSSDWLAFR